PAATRLEMKPVKLQVPRVVFLLPKFDSSIVSKDDLFCTIRQFAPLLLHVKSKFLLLCNDFEAQNVERDMQFQDDPELISLLVREPALHSAAHFLPEIV